ncbi:uracil-DNA glycosylase family protein [Bdellovibrio bacteriovorus]
MTVIRKLKAIHKDIANCKECPQMCGTPVHGPAIESSVMLIGQAPGVHESTFGKPFAYTAGKTLFKWFYEGTGIDEDTFRTKIYIAAVARCFPGKAGKGDREPSILEIGNCRNHLQKEVAVLKPKLVIAVGRVAITEVLGPKAFPKSKTLGEVVGKKLKGQFHGQDVDVICLPHPSGVSTWPHSVEGKKKLKKAFSLLGSHPDWQERVQ